MAKQLAKNVPQLASYIRKSVENNSDIGNKGLKEQFEKLLLGPLLESKVSGTSIPGMVIVMDALDECDVDNDILLILEVLPLLQKAKAMHLRVFLTSRLELPIRLGFKKIAHEDLVLHEIPQGIIEHDLSLILEHRIAEIREEQEYPLPIGWPGATNIQKLVALSVPLFIFAATICRLFEDPYWDSTDSLSEILAHQNNESKLDGTYLPVLNRILSRQREGKKDELIRQFHQVVGTIILLESPLSVTSLSKLIGLPEGIVHPRLGPLHSVLRVPNGKDLPVQLFHLSFRDFLLDPETCNKTPFWVHEKETHIRLATRCLHICHNLKKNICGLPGEGTERVDIDQKTIDRFLPPELQYACRYWVYHSVQSENKCMMIDEVLPFLRTHFLHWMEAMSILGHIFDAVGFITQLQAVTHKSDKNKDSELSEFLHDGKRFMLKNYQIADEAPLQLYCAGLLFAPQTSIIRRLFEAELPPWICQSPRAEERWSAELQALAGHSSFIYSVAFSPNGRMLASGSDDRTICIWDAATGALQQKLEGHKETVMSVVFSPDSHLLASGSKDGMVNLWNPATGALQQTLKSQSVSIVAFSPNGQLLASASTLDIVQIWDLATGTIQHVFEDRKCHFQTVDFSPDGRLLATISSSLDQTVELWDPVSGMLQQTLSSHSLDLCCVAFSPDGYVLTSDPDGITKIWDLSTGKLLQKLEGHRTIVTSVAFSGDGRLLASASGDGTVKLWDLATGALQQTLSHLYPVRSVAFSPDGRLIASGSYEEVVRLWDPAIDTIRDPHEGHEEGLILLAFSHNGLLLASGSDDQTVRLWDSAIGALQRTLESRLSGIKMLVFSPDDGLLIVSNNENVYIWDLVIGEVQQILSTHADPVMSLAFSPDGSLVATGSKKHKVSTWDIVTGEVQQTFEKHEDEILSVAFSPEGRFLASSSKDHKVVLWDTVTGELEKFWLIAKLPTWLEFSQFGSYLFTNRGAFDVRRWFSRLNPELSRDTPNIVVRQRRWVEWKGKKVLRLHQPGPHCWDVKSNRIALGYLSGRVSIIGFRSY